MKRLFSISLPALALAMFSVAGVAATPAAAADVRASLSTREAYVGSPLMLSLQIEDANAVDVPALPKVDGLDISSLGSPSRSSQTMIINGRRSHSVSETHAWQIIPRREGTFEIPSIDVEVDGQTYSTRPQRFVVIKSETGDLLFAEIEGHDEKIFVGQPMELTLKIWIKPYFDRELDLRLSEGDMWQMVSQDRSNWGIFSERLAEMEENRQRPAGHEVLRTDGDGNERAYYLYEIPATIYPKRPGAIDGDSVQIVVDYPTRLGKTRDPFDSFFGGRSSLFDDMPSMFGPKLAVTDVRPIVATADVNATTVSDVPTANRPADYRGAVGQYHIVTQATPTDVNAGDPITLYIGISGDGPMDLVQAPPLDCLSSDFRVSDDPLAGIVQDDTKLFTVSIRPRNESVQEIPAIPLTFFDPTKEEFITVYSRPIPINVAPADNLAADAIVGTHAPGAGETAQPDQPESYISYSNFSGTDVLYTTRPTGDWPWALAFVVPPLFFVAFLMFRHRNRWSTWLSVLPGATVRETHAALTRATSPSEVAETLHKFLARCAGESPSARSTRDLIAQLRLRGCGGIDGCEQLLERCERYSYAGSSGVDMPGLIQSAQAAVSAVSGTPAQAAGTPNTTIHSKMQGSQI